MPARQHSIALPKGRRLERLNALRGPAALLVVFYHVRQIAARDMGSSGIFEFWRFGHAGVDLFFVISGFVIYLVHRGDIARPQAVTGFLKRRLIRVYPPLWIVTTGVLIGALATAHAVRPEKMNLIFVVWSYLLWPIQGALPLVPPAWTLSHEVKFYLFFAAAIALPRQAWKPLAVGIFAGSVLVGALELFSPHTLPFALTFVLSPYNLEFAAGTVVAALVLERALVAAPVCGALGLVIWIAAAAHDQSLGGPDVTQVIRYGLPSALIVLAVSARDLEVPEFRAPVLRLLGDASYSIYLVHLPVIIVAIRLANLLKARPAASTLVAVAIVAIIAGIAFHLAVERPVTRFLNGHLAARRRGIVAVS